MKQFIKALPVLSIVLALALDALLPDNLQHPAAEHPYFAWLLITALVLYLIFYIASVRRCAKSSNTRRSSTPALRCSSTSLTC